MNAPQHPNKLRPAAAGDATQAAPSAEPAPTTQRSSSFDQVARTPAGHRRLHFFGAVIAWMAAATEQADSVDALYARHGFLRDYAEQIARPELQAATIDEAWLWWLQALQAWEANASQLPLLRVARHAGLDTAALNLWAQVALVEDEPRFGTLLAELQAGARRPCQAWLASLQPQQDPDASRQRIAALLGAGLLLADGDGPRGERTLRVPLAVWDAAGGQPLLDPALARFEPAAARPPSGALQLPPGLLDRLADPALPGVALRGLQGSGRLTLARACGDAERALLHVTAAVARDPRRWAEADLCAALLDARLVVDARRASDDALRGDWPATRHAPAPTMLLLPLHGGEVPVDWTQVQLAVPDAAARRQMLVQAAQARLASQATAATPETATAQLKHADNSALAALAALAAAHRLPAGRWHTLAALGARGGAGALARALQALGHPELDRLAERLAPQGDWHELALTSQTANELQLLEARCRCREALHGAVGATLASSLNPGVRALFKGPSGTGKTAAARILGARLGKPVFRVDLGRTVSKYIGETEANLGRLFDAAESIDAVLLFDEGDALMASRTGVSNANDRYANLETNFLLQAIERYQGILLVTTNAAERIDSAFVRRLDVTVDFPAPDAAARASILQLHLPSQHQVDAATLAHVSQRCNLSGGLWRNVVLHAALLSLQAGRAIGNAELLSALRREYRKNGQVCPLRADGERPGDAHGH